MSTKYTRDLLNEAVKASLSGAGVLRYLGLKQAGGTQAYIMGLIRNHNIDTSHWHRQAHNKGKVSPRRKTPEEIFIVLPAGSYRQKREQLHRALLEVGVDERCACGIESEWNGKPITLEIDHISGDWLDNRIENLRFICPNCHSQEDTTNMPHKYRN